MSVNIPSNDIIELSGRYEGCIFDVTANIISNIIDFHFVDSKQTSGTGKIELTNTGIDIAIKSDNVWDIDKHFSFEDKSDEVILKLNEDVIMDWLSGDITIKDLQVNGYDFQKVMIYMLDLELSIN